MAEINWNIIDANTPSKIATSFQDGQQNALARQSALQAQQLNALQLQKATNEMESEAAFTNALAQHGGDVQKALPTLMQKNPKMALGYQKMLQEQKTAEMTQQKAKLESAQKTLEVGGQLFSQVRDQATWESALQQLSQIVPPEVLANMPAQYDPAFVKQKLGEAMTLKDQIANKWKELDHNLSLAKFGYQRKHDSDTLAETKQHHANIADAYKGKPFEATGPDGKPVLVQQTKDGKLVPVDGYSPKVKGAEGGGKALPAQRIEELADMEQVRLVLKEAGELAANSKVSTGPVAGRMQSLGSKVGVASDDFVNLQQKFATAENIMLKLRSGAAVTDQEYARFKNEYPSVNDTKEIRTRKLGNAVKYATDLIDKKKAMYAEGGYKVPSLGGSGAATVNPPPTEHPDFPGFSLAE